MVVGVCSALTAEDTCASRQTRRRNLGGLLHLFSGLHSWDLRWPLHLSCLLAGALPPLAALSLSVPSRPGQAPCRTLLRVDCPLPPGLPEQAACVRGWEGVGEALWCRLSSSPAWTSSGHSGTEPGRVDSIGGEDRVDPHQWPPPGLEDRPELPGQQNRSHQVPPPHKAGPRVGARQG